MRKYVKTEDMSAAGKNRRISELIEESEAPTECPKCRGNQFVAFITTDFVMSDAVWDDIVGRWRVSGTSLGNLKLKSLQCINCGWKGEEVVEKPRDERPQTTVVFPR
jgi:hypothetical protein